MKISVIVPFHKKISSLKTSCNSINNQIIPNDFMIEIVIGNDSKYSDRYIKNYLSQFISKKIKILVIKNKNKKSAGNARNAAMNICTGEYIAFLDSDDAWEPIKLLMQAKYIYRNFDFITCGYRLNNEGTILSPPKKLNKSHNLFFDWNPVGTSTVVISKKILKDNKFSDLVFCQDILFWSDLFFDQKIKYISINLPLVKYSTSGRTSKAKLINIIKFYYIAARKSGLTRFLSTLSLSNYILRGIFNKFFKRNTSKFLQNKNSFNFLRLIRFLILIRNYFFQSVLFDFNYGVKTFFRKKFNGTKYTSLHKGSIHYVASSTDLIKNSLGISLDICNLLKWPHDQLQFVDLGSGQGKTMCVVAIFFNQLYKYNPILGVEFSKELTDIAKKNLVKLIPTNNFNIETKDVLSAIENFKEKIFIFYIYNSFKGKYFEEVCSHIAKFNKVLIIYLEPVESNILIKYGFKLVYSHKSALSFKNREFNIYINS